MTSENTIRHPDEDICFHLGLTMAGAVSGGAFTAGVVDHITQALDKWEAKKQDNRNIIAQHATLDEAFNDDRYDHSIPMHNVVIDVLGGASAGAIATVLTAVSFYHDYHGDDKSYLHEAWVKLADSQSKDTFTQLLQGNEESKDHIPVSLLNAAPLDKVKSNIIDVIESGRTLAQELPGYVGKQIELLLTVTSLKRIPIQLHLSPLSDDEPDQQAAHVMELHRALAHLEILSPQSIDDGRRIRIDIGKKTDLTLLFDLALSSGAFPIGLPPRPIERLPKPYILYQMDKLTGLNSLPKHLRIPDEEFINEEMNLTAVDGGVMNNDPFTQVNKILSRKLDEARGEHGGCHIPANIFIDPFPNFYEVKQYDPPKTMIDVAKQLFSAMLNQSRFKNKQDLKDFINSHNYGMVFPSYSDAQYKDISQNPLASGGIGGFAGFLNKKLREFDYDLGRRNAQSFIQHYFFIPFSKEERDAAETLGSDETELIDYLDRWSSEAKYIAMSKRFAVRRKSDPAQLKGMPIIPDLGISEEYKPREEMKRIEPEWDKWFLTYDDINKFKGVIRQRTRLIVNAFLVSTVGRNLLRLIYFSLAVIIVGMLALIASTQSTQTMVTLIWICATLLVLILSFVLLYIFLVTRASCAVFKLIRETLEERNQLRKSR